MTTYHDVLAAVAAGERTTLSFTTEADLQTTRARLKDLAAERGMRMRTYPRGLQLDVHPAPEGDRVLNPIEPITAEGYIAMSRFSCECGEVVPSEGTLAARAAYEEERQRRLSTKGRGQVTALATGVQLASAIAVHEVFDLWEQCRCPNRPGLAV